MQMTTAKRVVMLRVQSKMEPAKPMHNQKIQKKKAKNERALYFEKLIKPLIK